MRLAQIHNHVRDVCPLDLKIPETTSQKAPTQSDNSRRAAKKDVVGMRGDDTVAGHWTDWK